MHALNGIGFAQRFPVSSFRRAKLALPLGLSHLHFSTEYLRTGCVYIHWPYCEKKCTYCDFNKYVSPNVDHKRMQHCLVNELRHQLEESFIKNVNSVFFGGGTPSLALPSTIEVSMLHL